MANNLRHDFFKKNRECMPDLLHYDQACDTSQWKFEIHCDQFVVSANGI
jgi:hypothetical protein